MLEQVIALAWQRPSRLSSSHSTTIVNRYEKEYRETVKLTSLALAITLLGATAAQAQDPATSANLSTLQRMGNTATSMTLPTVAQDGKNADAIRANLKKVKLPDGFKIDLYAVVPDARYMAVAPPTCCSSARARPRSGQ